jgi:hypothetical protein
MHFVAHLFVGDINKDSFSGRFSQKPVSMIYVICCGVGSTGRVCDETVASNQGLDTISMWLNSSMQTTWGEQKAKHLRVRPRLESLLWVPSRLQHIL